MKKLHVPGFFENFETLLDYPSSRPHDYLPGIHERAGARQLGRGDGGDAPGARCCPRSNVDRCHCPPPTAPAAHEAIFSEEDAQVLARGEEERKGAPASAATTEKGEDG